MSRKQLIKHADLHKKLRDQDVQVNKYKEVIQKGTKRFFNDAKEMVEAMDEVKANDLWDAVEEGYIRASPPRVAPRYNKAEGDLETLKGWNKWLKHKKRKEEQK